jgi:predicted Zn-dependent protease
MEKRARAIGSGFERKNNRSRRSGKNYRIGSVRRFAVFLLLVAALAFLAGFAFAEKPVRAAEPIGYAAVEVRAGDTLWQIAAAYKSDGQDIRRLIYDICQINNISAGELRAGDMIQIPVSK